MVSENVNVNRKLVYRRTWHKPSLHYNRTSYYDSRSDLLGEEEIIKKKLGVFLFGILLVFLE